MKMVSLKLPKKSKNELKEGPISPLSNEYPYDSRLTIRDEPLKKMTEIYDKVNVGDIVIIKAKAKVISVSESKSQSLGNEKKHEECRIELQLTDIGCEMDDDGAMEEGFAEGSEDKKEE